MKKLFAFLLALTLFLSLGLTAFADTAATNGKVYAEEDGYVNILFSNGYRGFCIDYGLEDAVKGDGFTPKDTSAAKSNKDGRIIGEYLKMMFVEGFDSLFTVNSTDLTASLKQPLQVQKNVWYFSDSYAYGVDQSFLEEFRNMVKAGFTVPDHGYVKKINDTTLATFDFLVMETSKTGQQCFFGYKVTLSALPEPEITTPVTDTVITLAVGKSAELSVTADHAEEYLWQVDKGNGFEDIAGATETVLAVNSVTDENADYRYRCVAKNTAGSDISPVFSFNMVKAPEITSPTTDTERSVYPGAPLSFTVTATNEPEYQWQVDKGNGFEDIAGATEPTFEPPFPDDTNAGYKYRCAVTNIAGSDTSPVFTAKVLGKPVFTIPDEDKTFEVDERASALLTAEAENAVSYQWQIDRGDGFENISGATEPTYTVPAAEEEQDGYRYRCIATNPAGSAESFLFTQRVRNVDPPVITEGKDNSSVEAETDEEIVLKVEAEDGSDYQWQILTEDGFKDIEGATDPEYTVPTDKAGENDYRCVIGNENGEVVSGVFTVETKAPDTPENKDPDKETPDTGDGSDLILWVALLAICAAAVLFGAGYAKKKA